MEWGKESVRCTTDVGDERWRRADWSKGVPGRGENLDKNNANGAGRGPSRSCISGFVAWEGAWACGPSPASDDPFAHSAIDFTFIVTTINMRITYKAAKREKTLRERGLDLRRAREVFDGKHITVVDDRRTMASCGSSLPDGWTAAWSASSGRLEAVRTVLFL